VESVEKLLNKQLEDCGSTLQYVFKNGILSSLLPSPLSPLLFPLFSPLSSPLSSLPSPLSPLLSPLSSLLYPLSSPLSPPPLPSLTLLLVDPLKTLAELQDPTQTNTCLTLHLSRSSPSSLRNYSSVSFPDTSSGSGTFSTFIKEGGLALLAQSLLSTLKGGRTGEPKGKQGGKGERARGWENWLTLLTGMLQIEEFQVCVSLLPSSS
jgi:hypothetical protein